MKVRHAAALAIVSLWLMAAGCASKSEQGTTVASPSAQPTPNAFPETNCTTPDLRRSELEKGYRKCMSAFAGNPSTCSAYLQCWNQAK